MHITYLIAACGTPPPQKKNVIPEQPNIYLSHLYFWIERFSSIQHDLKFQINVTSYIKKINLMDFKVTEITEFTEIFDAFWDFSSLKRTFTWLLWGFHCFTTFVKLLCSFKNKTIAKILLQKVYLDNFKQKTWCLQKFDP